MMSVMIVYAVNKCKLLQYRSRSQLVAEKITKTAKGLLFMPHLHPVQRPTFSLRSTYLLDFVAAATFGISRHSNTMLACAPATTTLLMYCNY